MRHTFFTRRVRNIVMGATALVAATALAACGSTAPPAETDGPPAKEVTFSLAQPGTLTIATYGSNPPVNIDNPDGTEGGIVGALLDSFTAEYGLDIKLQPTTFASMILDVQQGRADMGLFVYWNEERSKQLYYTSAFFTGPIVVFTAKDFKYDGPDSMEGHKIGVVVGQLWTDLMTEAIGDDAVLFQGQPQAAQALLNGQIDGYMNGLTEIYNSPLAENQDDIASHVVEAGDWGMPSDMAQTFGYNIVSCENPELALALDEHMQKLIESGEWDDIFSTLPSEFMVENPTPPTQGCGS